MDYVAVGVAATSSTIVDLNLATRIQIDAPESANERVILFGSVIVVKTLIRRYSFRLNTFIVDIYIMDQSGLQLQLVYSRDK